MNRAAPAEPQRIRNLRYVDRYIRISLVPDSGTSLGTIAMDRPVVAKVCGRCGKGRVQLCALFAHCGAGDVAAAGSGVVAGQWGPKNEEGRGSGAPVWGSTFISCDG